MYECFRGELLLLLPTSAVIEVGGVGYAFSIPLSTFDRLKGAVTRAGVDVGEVRLYAHLYVREDELRLYGFATKEERRLFRMVLVPSLGQNDSQPDQRNRQEQVLELKLRTTFAFAMVACRFRQSIPRYGKNELLVVFFGPVGLGCYILRLCHLDNTKTKALVRN